MKSFSLAIFLGCVSISGAADPTIRLDLGAGENVGMLLIPAGEFTQGSPADEVGRGDDENQRKVRLTEGFYISRTAITRGQWMRFVTETGYRTEAEVGNSGGYGWDGAALTQRKEFTWKNPGFQQDATHPVCLVTFADARAFCYWLESRTNRKTTLPTEAQWEHACRAGTTTPWHTGDDTDAWHKGNSGNTTHPVDTNTLNPSGMTIGGNVAEWCLDWYAPYDKDAAVDPCQDDPNLSEKPRRVLRGGSWNRDRKNTRSAARFRADPRSRNADIGFRIVCQTEAITQAAVASPVADLTGVEAASPFPSIPESSRFPSSHSPFPSSGLTGESAGRSIGGWLCLLVPIALMAALIRFFVKRGQSSSPPAMRSRPMPPPVNVPQRGVRMVDNGFWIHSDWPVGTPIHLSYLVNGTMEHQTLVYQPSNQGQFIFTGDRPEKVTISGTGAQPPPLESEPPPLDSLHGPRHHPTHRPPFSPSAY